jgi:CheY-like chemotaxis protein
MNTLENRRLLLVDDTPAIHEDFRKILTRLGCASALSDSEAGLFGETPQSTCIGFEMHSALQGAQAIEKVRAAVHAQRPYAMAFVDMRMPPGMDGVETTERLWQEDPEVQVVLCTAERKAAEEQGS